MFLSFIFLMLSLMSYVTELALLQYLSPLTTIIYTVALLLTIIILIYLFQSSIRRYFHIIDLSIASFILLMNQ